MPLLRCLLDVVSSSQESCPQDCCSAIHEGLHFKRRTAGGKAMNSKIQVIPIEIDVLAIGGGLAGCMAAIKARKVKKTDFASGYARHVNSYPRHHIYNNLQPSKFLKNS
jgi:hypothetical protein